MGKIILGVSTAWQMTGSSSDQMREAVSDHYKVHESEYYELAVMQAYTEGVQLSLQEPLVIGNTSSQLSIDFHED